MFFILENPVIVLKTLPPSDSCAKETTVKQQNITNIQIHMPYLIYCVCVCVPQMHLSVHFNFILATKIIVWRKKKSKTKTFLSCFVGKGGKNRRRGKNESEDVKRELVFKEDGQGESFCSLSFF